MRRRRRRKWRGVAKEQKKVQVAGGSIDEDHMDQHGREEKNVPSVMDYSDPPQYLDATRMTRAAADASPSALRTLPTLWRHART